MKERFVEDLLAYLLQRSSHLVTTRFHEVLRFRGISKSRWRLLIWLSDGGSFTVTELAYDLMLEQPTTTKLVNAAAKEGLVEKSTDKSDGRKVRVAITPNGLSYIERVKQEAIEGDQVIAQTYGEAEIAELKKQLLTLIRRHDAQQQTGIEEAQQERLNTANESR